MEAGTDQDEEEGLVEEQVQLASIESRLIEIRETIGKLNEEKNKLERLKKSIEQRQLRQQNEQLQSQDWAGTHFPWSQKVSHLLRSKFALQHFRSLQLSAINAFLSGHDVMVIMPTGGGKSLCFQMSALAKDQGFTLVVCPLVALMEDQVLALHRRNIEAIMLSAGSSREQVNAAHAAMLDPESGLKLLYVTPERLAKSKRFMSKLQQSYGRKLLCGVAIDEVHCCSQWGHDFRPDYKFLGVLKNLFSEVPILGLTATCSDQVADDVKQMLRLQHCLIFRAPLNRPNLFYEVRAKPDGHKDCVEQLYELLTGEFAKQSGIIYTLSIKDAETLCSDLKSRGLGVGCYHANLDPAHRSQVHHKWLDGRYQVVVATIAFGMGIDKADVRFVLHHSMSKSMENYYQESGRCGRDDQPARCILFYRLADLFRLSTMVFTEQTGLDKLYQMLAYCLDRTQCRRVLMANHLGQMGQAPVKCQEMCDFCSCHGHDPVIPLQMAMPGLNSLLTTLTQQPDQRITGLKLVDAIRARGLGKLRCPDWKQDQRLVKEKMLCELVVALLILEGHLREDFHFTPYNAISYLEMGSRPVPDSLTLPIPQPHPDSTAPERPAKLRRTSSK